MIISQQHFPKDYPIIPSKMADISNIHAFTQLTQSRVEQIYAMIKSMDTMSLITLSLTVAATIVLAIGVHRVWLHPLSHLPGPFVARFTGEWRNRRYRGRSWHQDVLNLHKKYVRVVRIAPNEVSVVDGFAMKQLYGHGHNAAKTKWYSVWDPPNTCSAAIFGA